MSDFIYDMNLTMGGTFGPEWEFDKIMSSCTYYFKESIHALLNTRVVNYLPVNLLLLELGGWIFHPFSKFKGLIRLT